MTSDSSEKETNTIVEKVDRRPGLKPIWEYDWKTESVRAMPRTPMAIAWYGIILAMGWYPLVIGAIMAAIEIFSNGFQYYPAMIGEAAFFVVFGFLGGATVGMIMTIPAYPLLQVIGWISGGTLSGRGASGIFGGLTGFLTSSGAGLLIAGPWMSTFEMITFMGTASLLAIVMGYVGAIWFGYRNRDNGFPFFDPLFSVDKQFTIWFLLKLMTLVAALSVVCKAVGPVGLKLGIAWALYGAFQVLLLLCDHWLGCWMGWRKSTP